MDIIVMLDKEKLPKDLLEELEKNLSKEAKQELANILSKNREQLLTNQPNEQPNKDQKMFAIQTGTVVGNIYTDGIYKKEEDSYTKNKDIKDLGGCC